MERSVMIEEQVDIREFGSEYLGWYYRYTYKYQNLEHVKYVRIDGIDLAYNSLGIVVQVRINPDAKESYTLFTQYEDTVTVVKTRD